MAVDGDHYKLAFDKPGTWSQKYNLVWDQMLDLNLFPAKVRQTEIAFYLQHLNQFGLPLDNRARLHQAGLGAVDGDAGGHAAAGETDAFARADCDRSATGSNEGPTRVPLTDWYDTKNGKQMGFQARSVVGGVYIKALADKELAAKWRNAN